MEIRQSAAASNCISETTRTCNGPPILACCHADQSFSNEDTDETVAKEMSLSNPSKPFTDGVTSSNSWTESFLRKTCPATLVSMYIAIIPPSLALGGQEVSIAVLPFYPISPEKALEHWQDTIPLLLKIELRGSSSVNVAPDESFDFMGDSAVEFGRREVGSRSGDSVELVRGVGQAIGVSKVVWGQYELLKETCQLKVTILDVGSKKQSPALTAVGADWQQAVASLARLILGELHIASAADTEQTVPVELHGSAAAMDILGRALFDSYRGKPINEVEAGLREAVKLDPTCWLAQEALAHELAIEDKFDEATAIAKFTVKSCPDSALSHYILGMIYVAEGLNSLAQEQLLEAKRLDPREPNILIQLAESYTAQRKWDQAGSLLQQAEKQAPYIGLIHQRLGWVYAQQGDRDRALTELRLAERYDTGRDGQILISLARTYDYLRNTPKAVYFYQKFLVGAGRIGLQDALVDQARAELKVLELKLKPQFVVAAAPRVRSRRSLEKELKKRLTPEERKMVPDPFARNPEMAKWVRKVVGDAMTGMDKAQRLYNALTQHPVGGPHWQRTAEEAFRALFDPVTSMSCEDYSLLFAALAREAGLRAFFVLVEKDYQSKPVLHACAALWLQNGSLLVDPAVNWFGVPHQSFRVLDDLQATALLLAQSTNPVTIAIAPKLAPEIALVHFDFALDLAQRGERLKAEDALQRGLKIDSTSWLADFFQGSIALTRGKAEDAVKYLCRAQSRAPDFSTLHYVLGRAYQLQNKLTEARAEYRAFLDAPDNQKYIEETREALWAINATLAGRN
jgi:tetratricopeptide (TPR) repeat protein